MPFKLCSHVFWVLSFWLFPLPVFFLLGSIWCTVCFAHWSVWLKLLCLIRNHLLYEVVLTSKRTLGQKWEYLLSAGYTDLGCASLLESSGLPEKCAIPSLNCYKEQCLNKYLLRFWFYFTLSFWIVTDRSLFSKPALSAWADNTSGPALESSWNPT